MARVDSLASLMELHERGCECCVQHNHLPAQTPSPHVTLNSMPDSL
jgi:hypothetical protein